MKSATTTTTTSRRALQGLAMAAALFAAAAAQATDVGVSINISQPGVYGRIDIGRFPQPALVVMQPVVVYRPVQVQQPAQPVYLWVPPGHRKKWSKHCGEYGACGVPVYFVQDGWYRDHVMVDRRDDDDRGHQGHGKEKKQKHNKGHGRDD